MLTSSKDALALAVLVGILSSDLSLAGGVGQWEHQRLLHMLAHLLNHFLQSPQPNDFLQSKQCNPFLQSEQTQCFPGLVLHEAFPSAVHGRLASE